MSEYDAVSVMNSESRGVPGTTTPPSPITWSFTTCRRGPCGLDRGCPRVAAMSFGPGVSLFW